MIKLFEKYEKGIICFVAGMALGAAIFDSKASRIRDKYREQAIENGFAEYSLKGEWQWKESK